MKNLEFRIRIVLVALCLLSPALAPAATVAWTNTSGGDWSVAGNWTPNQVPGDGDTAIITSNGTYTVTLDVSATIASLTLGGTSGKQTLTNSGNSLTLTNASTVATNGIFGFSGGTLDGAGLLTVRGVFNWTDGTIGSSGRVTIATNATMNLSGGAIKYLYGALTNAGTVNWSGTGDVYVYNNNGVNWSGAIINLAGGLFDMKNDQSLVVGAGFEYFNNAGTVRKSAGSGTNNVNFLFNNTGTVDVQAGSLSLNGGGTGSGVFSGAGRTLIITSGYTFSPGSVNTATTNFWTGGTVTLNTSLSVTNLQLAGATVTGSGLLTVNTLNFSSGTLDLPTTVTGPMGWTDGFIGNAARVTIATNATLNLSGGATKILYGMLTNAGTVNWSGTGDVYVYNNNGVNWSGAIINLAGGLFDMKNDQSLVVGAGFEYFNNAGTVRKSAGSGTNNVNFLFNNTGTVDVQAGSLSFNGGGTGSGAFNGAGRTLIITAGYTFSPGSVNTATTNFWTGGTVTLNTSLSVTNLQLAGATVTGSGLLTVNTLNFSSGTLDLPTTVTGPMGWTDGFIGNAARVTIATNATLNLSGGATKILYGALTNAGTVNWSGTGDVYVYNNNGVNWSGAIINLAGGLFDMKNDQSLVVGAGFEYFNNAGTVRKSAGSGTNNVNFLFNNTGTVDVQAGSLSLNGGGTGSGVFSGAGRTLIITSGYTFSPGSVNTATTNFWTGGTVTLNTSLSVTNLQLAGATVTGSGLLTVNTLNFSSGTLDLPTTVTGPMGWTDGFIGNAARVTIATNATLNLSGGATKILYGMLTNAGTVNWSGTGDVYVYNNNGVNWSGAIINLAGGLFDMKNDQSLVVGAGFEYFNNAGTVRKSAGSGTNNVNFLFNNTGTVDVQTNAVSFNGSYTLTGGTLNFGINSLTQFGRIILSGSAILEGTVSANLNNGYSPVRGNAFAVLGYGSETGIFTNVNLPSHWAWQTNYGATVFTLSILNTAPTLPGQTNRTISELATLVVTNTATDPDLPADTLTHTLLTAPGAATIATNTGVITWVTTEADGPGTNVFTTRVVDNGTPSLAETNTFTVIVTESNRPPVLTLPENQTINELVFYTNNATASDPDVPANTLTFALVSGPTNLTVSPAGAITWTPSEAQGPSTNVVQIKVTDTNPPAVNATSLSVTSSFTLTVSEVNVAPILTLPASQTFNELTFYTNNATATDGDAPANALTFTLVSGPANLTVSPAGAITWTPSEAQGPSTNVVQIKVTDSNPPAVNATSLSVTSSFTLTVSEVNVAPAITVPGNQTIHAGVSLSLNATATDADLPTNTLTFASVSGPAGLTVSGAGLITWPTGDANAGTTNPVSVRVFDNGVPSLSSTGAFNVVVVSRPLLLAPAISETNFLNLTWTAIPATSYRLQFNTDLTTTNWTSLAGDVTAASNTASKLDPLTTSNRLYRVRVLP